MPLNIDWQQILLHLLNFLILAVGLYFILYKPVKKFMKKREDDYAAREEKTAEALKDAESSRAEYEKTVMSAFKDVYDARVTYNSAIENTNYQTDLLNASAKYYRLANLQYINGAISYLDVLDAQRRYFDAQVSHLSAVRDEYLALVSLYKALGGGWR